MEVGWENGRTPFLRREGGQCFAIKRGPEKRVVGGMEGKNNEDPGEKVPLRTAEGKRTHKFDL